MWGGAGGGGYAAIVEERSPTYSRKNDNKRPKQSLLTEEQQPQYGISHELLVPAVLPSFAGDRAVSVAVKMAAELLLSQEPEAVAGSRIASLLKARDESVEVDPMVHVWGAVKTPTCIIRMEEFVPVSFLLMAMATRSCFTVRLTARATLEPQPFYDPEGKSAFALNVSPYLGQDPDLSTSQSFGLRGLLEQTISEKSQFTDLPVQVSGYMASLGELSTIQAGTLDFIMAHFEAFENLASGRLVVVRPLIKKSRVDSEY